MLPWWAKVGEMWRYEAKYAMHDVWILSSNLYHGSLPDVINTWSIDHGKAGDEGPVMQ